MKKSYRYKLEKYRQFESFFRTCSGDYKCGNPVAFLKIIYGTDFPVCRAHRKERVLGGVGNFWDWIRDKQKDQRLERKGKLRYPRTTLNRQRALNEIRERIQSRAGRLKKKHLRRAYRDYLEVTFFKKGHKSFSSFMMLVQS